MLISLHIVYGCIYATKAVLGGCNKDQLNHKAKNIYYLSLYRKDLLTLILMKWWLVKNRAHRASDITQDAERSGLEDWLSHLFISCEVLGE